MSHHFIPEYTCPKCGTFLSAHFRVDTVEIAEEYLIEAHSTGPVRNHSSEFKNEVLCPMMVHRCSPHQVHMAALTGFVDMDNPNS